MEKVKVFIDGSEGTTGLRINERMAMRDDIELLTIDGELRKDTAERARLINSADVVFLCLPDAAARESVSLIDNDRVKVIDTSTAHRTAAGWAYGFPELSDERRAEIALSKRVAVPGCHASGAIALLYPLIAAGVLPCDYPAAFYSLTGYSGGGKKMIASYEAADRPAEYDSPRQYGLTQSHKHLPEIVSVCGLKRTPAFAPIVADYYSGMEVSFPLFTDMLNKNADSASVREIYARHYEGSGFFRVLPYNDESLGGFIGSNNLSGKDGMEIIVTGNEERIVAVARFDNLGKGASGAAMQCFNIMTGRDEATSLNL